MINRTAFKYFTLAIMLIVVMLIFRRCGCGGGNRNQHSDTISVKHDTVFVQSKSDTHYIPQPFKVVKYVTIKETSHDTLEVFNLEHVDSLKILADYLATRYYFDSIAFKYGKVYVRDTVTQNRIIGRGVRSDFSVPVITNTITLREKKRTVLYLGAEGFGNEKTLVYGIGVNAGLEFKNRKYWGVSYILTKDGAAQYGLRFMIPIRFRKQ